MLRPDPMTAPWPDASDLRTVTRSLRCIRRFHDIPAASFAVATGDGPARVALSGLADPASRQRMSPWTRMLVGSVGKTFVAAAARRLVLAGELDLDAPVVEQLGGEVWYESLPGARAITLRHLLQHRSGLPRYVFEPELWERILADPDRRWTVAERLAFVAGESGLHEPGAGFSYSDTNYLIVGELIERATGEELFAHLRRAIVEPAGLTRTTPSDRRDIRALAQGHASLLRPHGLPALTVAHGRLVYGPQFEGAGGGWATTSADLATWMARYATGRAFEGDAPQDPSDFVDATYLGDGARYGLGIAWWPAVATGVGELLGHEGVMPGYRSIAVWSAERGLAFALQISTDERVRGGMLGLVRELVKAV